MAEPPNPAALPKLVHTFLSPRNKEKTAGPTCQREEPFHSFFTLLSCQVLLVSNHYSTSYIQGWLNKLQNDKKFIVEASAKAQQAVDYILNIAK